MSTNRNLNCIINRSRRQPCRACMDVLEELYRRCFRSMAMWPSANPLAPRWCNHSVRLAPVRLHISLLPCHAARGVGILHGRSSLCSLCSQIVYISCELAGSPAAGMPSPIQFGTVPTDNAPVFLLDCERVLFFKACHRLSHTNTVDFLSGTGAASIDEVGTTRHGRAACTKASELHPIPFGWNFSAGSGPRWHVKLHSCATIDN